MTCTYNEPIELWWGQLSSEPVEAYGEICVWEQIEEDEDAGKIELGFICVIVKINIICGKYCKGEVALCMSLKFTKTKCIFLNQGQKSTKNSSSWSSFMFLFIFQHLLLFSFSYTISDSFFASFSSFSFHRHISNPWGKRLRWCSWRWHSHHQCRGRYLWRRGQERVLHLASEQVLEERSKRREEGRKRRMWCGAEGVKGE